MRTVLRSACIGLALIGLSEAAHAQAAPNFGTANQAYFRISATGFQPLNTVDGPVYTTGVGLVGEVITRHGSGNSLFTAQVNIPAGALVTSIEFDYCDNNPGSNPSFLRLVETSYTGDVLATTPEVYSSHVGCSYALADVTASAITIDNYLNSYHLVFYHNIGDGTESIAGASVGYKLQVSPAPATADFGDVPTNHPFFQYIEALYASGITGGCGGGNYCPNNPVTRGQMAVFLAKALGLEHQ